MNRTRLLTTMALFVAIGTLGSHLLWFPAGIAKAYPVQHAVNVLAAVTLGPLPAAARRRWYARGRRGPRRCGRCPGSPRPG